MAWLCAVLMVPLILFIWALDTKKTRINRYRKTGGVGERLLMFTALVQLLSGGGLFLKQVFLLAERVRHFCVIYFFSISLYS